MLVYSHVHYFAVTSTEIHLAFQQYFENHLQDLIYITLVVFFSSVSFVTSRFPDHL